MVALPKGAVTTGAMDATIIETTGVVVSAVAAPRISAKQPASAFCGEYTEANVIAEAHSI